MKATPDDIKLMHYLFDYKNIKPEVKYSDFLRKVEEEAIHIYKNNLYSNINAQDENGNTFLHFAVESGSKVWVNELLRKGANPLIKNNDGRDPLRNISQLIEHKSIKLNEKFNEETKGFSPEYKQVLFNARAATDYNLFKDFEEIGNYLHSINLYTSDNHIQLLIKSAIIESDDKLAIYMKNFDSPESNSLLLRKFLICVNERDFIFESYLTDEFLERSFSYDESFRESLDLLARSIPEDTQEQNHSYHVTAFSKVLGVMFREKFDFQYISWGPTVEENLLTNPQAGKIYLKEKLDFGLKKSDSVYIKPLKI